MTTEINLFKSRVLVTELEFGIEKTRGGVIITDDDGKSHGIKPRWAKVYKTGPDVEKIKSGDYVLLKHGRWTRGFDIKTQVEGRIKVFMIDYPDAVLIVSKERPDILNRLKQVYEK